MPFPNPGTQIRPGERRNPEGRNQYTYRRVWEQEIEAALTERDPETGETGAQILARKLVEWSKAGNEKMVSELLRRVWPATSRHELTGAEGAPLGLHAPVDEEPLPPELEEKIRELVRDYVTRPQEGA